MGYSSSEKLTYANECKNNKIRKQVIIMNNNTTGITKRTDLKAYSADIYEVHLFCAHCDPEGMGGKGGSIYTSTFSHDEAITRAQKFNHFCPTCGRKIDYNNIVKDFKIHLS